MEMQQPGTAARAVQLHLSIAIRSLLPAPRSVRPVHPAAALGHICLWDAFLPTDSLGLKLSSWEPVVILWTVTCPGPHPQT